jgi:aspartyl-tRNA(Asn)/glutamyl-tRNA(Gln) amidotransferase subunit C
MATKVTKDSVLHIAKLCDVGIDESEIEQLTDQFSEILEFWSSLDELNESGRTSMVSNVFREDVVCPSLTQEEALSNAHDAPDGYFKAPRVM